jgi:hypothetical protein
MVNEAVAALDAGATTVFSELRGKRGLTVAELADRTGLLPAVVRISVRELAVRGVAWRPVTGCECGRWRLVNQPGAPA